MSIMPYTGSNTVYPVQGQIYYGGDQIHVFQKSTKLYAQGQIHHVQGQIYHVQGELFSLHFHLRSHAPHDR